jgi:hypothetical protein
MARVLRAVLTYLVLVPLALLVLALDWITLKLDTVCSWLSDRLEN